MTMGFTYNLPVQLTCDVCKRTESMEENNIFHAGWAVVDKVRSVGALVVCRLCLFAKVYISEGLNPALYSDAQERVYKWPFV